MNYIRTGIFLLAVGLAGCGKGAHDPAVVARVNGRNILLSDVERQFQLQTLAMPQKPSGDAAGILKLDILRQLIGEEIMLQKAEEMKLKPTDAEVETEFTMLKGNATPEEFKKTMEQRGWNEEALRREIRKNLAVQKLMQNQIGSQMQVTPEQISRYYEENKNRFYVQELEYHIAQIVVSPDPDRPVANLKKDKAKNEQEASRKVQMLTSRLQAGEDFEQLAREYSEDAATAPGGGDLGFHPVSTFNGLSPQMKEAFLKMKVGDVSPAVQTGNGYLILKLLGKREPGQLPLQEPEVNQSIRQELESQKQQLLSSAYSENLRNEAQVENFLVRDLVAGFQKPN